MYKFIIVFFTLSFAQNVSAPQPKMILTDILLTQNLKSNHLSSGGGSIGGFGGGDTTDRRRLAAWFYGDQQILTCLQVNKNFELQESEIKDYLSEAISLWKNYFSDKKINSELTEKINFNFYVKPSCTGGEDLVLYFGTGPIFQNLLDLRAFQSLSNPVAYVNKTYMSSDFKWSKGYIRFVESDVYKLENDSFPKWSNKEKFYQILVHEIGHILGFAHTPGTVMTGSIVRDVIVDNKKFESVDESEELYPCPTCSEIFELIKSNDLNLIPTETRIVLTDNLVKFHTKDLKPVSILQKELQPNLISLFEDESKLLKLNHIYFINHLNLNLVLVREGSSLKVFSNGQQLAEFSKGDL